MLRSAPIVRSGFAALAAALLLAPAAHAQQLPPQQNLPPEVQAMLEELDAVQERLEKLQNDAIEGSPELQEKQADLSQRVGEAILEVEPEYDELRARYAELEREVQAAQQAQDAQRFSQIMTEAQGIQVRLETAQGKVFEREEIVAAVEDYQGSLLTEMTELDPETPDLIERMEALMEQLSEIFGPGPGGTR